MVASPRGDLNLRRTSGSKKKGPREIILPREMEGEYDFTNKPRSASSRNGKHTRDPPGERQYDKEGSRRRDRSRQRSSSGKSREQGTPRRHITKRPDPEDPLFAPGRRDMRRRSNHKGDDSETRKSKSSRSSTTASKKSGKQTNSPTYLVVDSDTHGKVVGEYRRGAKSSTRTVVSGSTRGTAESGSKKFSRKLSSPPSESRGRGYTSGSDSPAVLDSMASSLVEMIFSPQKGGNRGDSSDDESDYSRESVSTGTSEEHDDSDVSDESSFDVATRGDDDDERSVFSRMTANMTNAKQLVPKADPLKYFMLCTAPEVGDGGQYRSFDDADDEDEAHNDKRNSIGYCAASEPFDNAREGYHDDDDDDAYYDHLDDTHDDYSAIRDDTERADYDDDYNDYGDQIQLKKKPFNVVGLAQCLQPTDECGERAGQTESHVAKKGQSQTPEYQWRSRPNGRIMADGNGNIYKGDVMDGMRHGYGSMRFYSTRDEYQGQWEEDKPHGWGKVTRGDKTLGSFEGFWEHGVLRRVKTGFASVVDDDGNQYAGNHENWKRHGEGTMTKTNGEKYTGLWSNGLRHGYGIIEYPDGTRFEGLFQNDVPTNEGHTFSSPSPESTSKRRQFVQETTAPSTRTAAEPPEEVRKQKQPSSSSLVRRASTAATSQKQPSTAATSHNTQNTKNAKSQEGGQQRPNPQAEKEKEKKQEQMLQQQRQQQQERARSLSSKPPRAPSKLVASWDTERREAPPRDAVEEARLSLDTFSRDEDATYSPSFRDNSINNFKETDSDDLGKEDDDFPLVAASNTATTAKSSAAGTPTEYDKHNGSLLRGRGVIMQRIRSATKVLRKLRREDGGVVERESLSSGSYSSGSFATPSHE